MIDVRREGSTERDDTIREREDWVVIGVMIWVVMIMMRMRDSMTYDWDRFGHDGLGWGGRVEGPTRRLLS